MLTNVHARNAKPKEKPYKLSDEAGLYLLVDPRGSKYWKLKYRFLGKEKKLAFGVYPEVSLVEAREKRDAARKLLAYGKDPSEVRKAAKRAQVHQAANSFEAVAREWLEKERPGWTEDHTHRVLNSLEKGLFPHIGRRPIADITSGELLAEIRKIEKRGALEIAARVLQRAGAVFRYAIATDRLKSNPAADLRGSIKVAKVKHRPALAESELPEFLRRLEDYSGDPQTKLGLNLILLTLVRTGELRSAEWAEVDLEKGEWRIPAERMKMKAPHLVPLSRQAVVVLDELRLFTGHRRLMFPSQQHAEKPMSENTMLYAMYRMGYHSRATVHGFRATASTTLNEQGFNPDVIERALAHVEQNKVRAAYNRAVYLEERRKMMQHWADYLDSLRGAAYA